MSDIDYKMCVIIPVYNNDMYIQMVIDDVKQYCNDIIVVNDGSTDKTKEVILKNDVIYVEHIVNKGKGIALQTGFAEGIKRGYTHGYTLDGDAQHMAKFIPPMKELSLQDKTALVLGCRVFIDRKVPTISKFGKWFSNMWVKLDTGYQLPDTQSGQRIYPLEKILSIKTNSRKYDYELEILVNAAWNGVPIKWYPTEVRYDLPQGRVSHYHYFRDNVRMTKMNATLFLKRVFLGRRVYKNIENSVIKTNE